MIKAATPAYNHLEKRLPKKWIRSLNHLTMSHPATGQQNLWKQLLMQMASNTVIYGILSSAVIAVMFTFLLPFTRNLLPGWNLHWYANAITGVVTVVCIAPFLRAMVMKKNHSEQWKALWRESNRNRLFLLVTVLVRFLIAIGFIFYICNYLTRFTNAVMICIGVLVVVGIILSRRIKHRSIRLERLFILNLRSRDIEAQVRGRKKPLYEGHLLDRNIHISDIDIPEDSRWAGKSLRDIRLGQRFGIHVSSILRGRQRINIPGGSTVIFPGDRLQVIGSDDQLTQLTSALEKEQYEEDPDIEKRETRLKQIVLTKNHEFTGKTLLESGIRDRYNCMVVGIEEGKENLSQVRPDYVFQTGDILWLVGEEENLRQLDK